MPHDRDVPRRPSELPPAIRGRAFGIHESALVTPSRLRSSDLWIPARGTRLARGATTLLDRCAAHALTLPSGAVFSGFTAALLLNLPLPWWAREAEDVDVTVPRGTRAPRRRGMTGHQRDLPADQVVLHSGLALTSPARTFLDLGSALPVPLLVAVGDRIIARRSPLATRAQLEAVVTGSSARGSQGAREALLLLDPGSESPKETELRLLLESAGLGPFATNHEVRDAAGRLRSRTVAPRHRPTQAAGSTRLDLHPRHPSRPGRPSRAPRGSPRGARSASVTELPVRAVSRAI